MAKKSKVRDDDDDDRDDEAPKPKSDAYVGMLGITLTALLAGCVLMYLDHDEISTAAGSVQPPTVNTSADGLEYRAPAAGNQ